jgi:hypothetical protein
MATFEPDDLEDAIQCCRNTIHIAQLLLRLDHFGREEEVAARRRSKVRR